MLKFLTEKPKGHFEDLPDDQGFIWLEGFTGGEQVYSYIALQIVGVHAGLHVEIVEFSHKIMKVMELDHAYLIGILNGFGVKNITASNKNLEDEDRWAKFIKRLGYPPPEKVMISTININGDGKWASKPQ